MNGGSVCRLAALLLNIASRFLVSYHRAHIRSTSLQGDQYGRGGDFCRNQANSSVIISASNTKLQLPHSSQQKLFHHHMGQPVLCKNIASGFRNIRRKGTTDISSQFITIIAIVLAFTLSDNHHLAST